MSEYQQDVLATLTPDVLAGDALMLRMVDGWVEAPPIQIALDELCVTINKISTAFVDGMTSAMKPFEDWAKAFSEVRFDLHS